jgi:hypothetical protein
VAQEIRQWFLPLKEIMAEPGRVVFPIWQEEAEERQQQVQMAQYLVMVVLGQRLLFQALQSPMPVAAVVACLPRVVLAVQEVLEVVEMAGITQQELRELQTPGEAAAAAMPLVQTQTPAEMVVLVL